MAASRQSQSTRAETAALAKSISAVDLFCGAGGLTRGLENAGIDVTTGVDIDPDCEYPYAANNKAHFLLKSVGDLTADDFERAYKDAPYKLLAGCAPCQPFSTYQQGKSGPADARWNLLDDFGRIVREVMPDLVTMENVPRLVEQDIFADFVAGLEAEGFHVEFKVVNCADYGVPQQRNRLVLLASKLGPIELIEPTTPAGKQNTVRKAIANLPELAAGEACPADPLHQCSSLSPLNLRRIRASKPGGTWRDWDEDLIAECHKKSTGKTYPSVYGRMSWDEPAPTMTTQYYGFGNGRFGHPEQDRAISLREGAILQSFPRNYKFVPTKAPIHMKSIGRLIGNAVPVRLGRAIGRSIVLHVREHAAERKQAA
ncbi:DNA cytosine methyltransferase [Labrenzia sp. R5_0]|uniref:DNA cytosine methyltransferase n=1 Tax=Labrenzia sp. R5_0 TaxID=2821108 RepID=UPI001ADB4348|nr:DNA cytosine methyltransferase [Labrenzia sp. R5_0]MBO9460683.1 DNA cytosine methyltransferase [Labrenzia sp. R5_0]